MRQNTKHETKIEKNSTEMLLCLEIFTYKSPKLPAGWFLWISKISQIILHSSVNQYKKIMTIMTAKNFEPTFSLVF